jgi:outer membrane receptor protein involved in Fe transport
VFDSKTIDRSGATNVEDFLKNRLTMNTVAQTSSQTYGVAVTSGSMGNTSTINLRGLGANDTLILVDGRRVSGISFFAGNLQPDINGIPLAAIDRIEVLPSSASGIYGGSAIGGVVNIILKKDYVGAEVRTTYDSTWDGHGPLRTANVTFGQSLEGGKTRVFISAQYADSKPMLIGDRISIINRGYAAIVKNSPGFFNSNINLFPPLGGTPNITSLAGVSRLPDGTFTSANLTLKGSGASLNSNIATLPAGYGVNSNPSTIIGGQYNLSLPDSNETPNGLLVPTGNFPKDKTLMATVNRQMTQTVELFAEYVYANNGSSSDYNPANISNANSLTVSSGATVNPFNQNVFISVPLNLSAPLLTNSTTRTATLGLKAKLPWDWIGELDYTWSTNAFNSFKDNFDTASLNTDLASGVVNPFVDALVHPLNLAPYLAPASYTGSSTLNDFALRAAGPLGQFRWGNPTLALNLEHRKEDNAIGHYVTLFPLTPSLNQDEILFPQSQSTDAMNAELQVPVVTAKNAVTGIQSLEFQLADRIESYSVRTGTLAYFTFPNNPVRNFYSPTPPNGVRYQIKSSYNANTQTIGLKYKPIRDLAFRASFAKAFLPPNYSQLLRNPIPSLPSGSPIIDPKTGTTYSGYTTLGGGNPDLRPQHSKSWTFGLIYEPQRNGLQGLRIDLEYYDITQLDYITTLTAQQMVNDPAFADRITRDPNTNLITQIDLSLINANQYQTKGWDLTLAYRKQTAVGTFELDATGTQIEHERRQLTFNSPLREYVGYVSAGGEAKTKANATLSWERSNWVAGWTTT